MDKNKALKIIKERRYAAAEKAYAVNSFLEEQPQYKKLRAEISQLTIQGAKGDASAYEKRTLKEKELSHFLANFELSEKDLVPQYFCTICNDTGFIRGEDCNCLKELTHETAVTALDNMTFENADKSLNTKFMEYCRNYVLFPKNAKNNMLVFGAAGTGKTYTVCAIKNLLEQLGENVLFYSAFDIEREFLKIHLSDPYTGEKLWNRLISVDYLIIDDLGTESTHNNVSVESFFNLYDKRAMMGKHTITTTNLVEDDLTKRYTARTFSRLTNVENTLYVKLTGKDLRHRKINV